MEGQAGRRSCCLLAIVMVFFLGLVAEISAEPVKPVLVVENPEHNFGTVPQGKLVEHAFIIRNDGNTDLEINRVVAACGCTATVLDDRSVKPGGETRINVGFDTSGFTGEKLKTVRLYTNDGDQGAAILSVRGVVEPELSVLPARIVFGNITASELEEGVSRELRVQIKEGSSVRVSSFNTHSPYISVEELDSDNGDKRYNVSLSADIPMGELRERIVLSIQGGDRSSVNVPVFASVQGNISLSATTVSFGIIEGVETLSRSVRLRDVSGKTVSIKEIRSSDAAVTTEHRAIKDGKEHVITVHVDPSRVRRDLRAALDIIVDDATQGSLPLSVYGVLPPQM